MEVVWCNILELLEIVGCIVIDWLKEVMCDRDKIFQIGIVVWYFVVLWFCMGIYMLNLFK